MQGVILEEQRVQFRVQQTGQRRHLAQRVRIGRAMAEVQHQTAEEHHAHERPASRPSSGFLWDSLMLRANFSSRSMTARLTEPGGYTPSASLSPAG